jgi:hypothetical protein
METDIPEKDRPNIVAFYSPRKRSPSWTTMMKWWKNNSEQFNVHLKADTDTCKCHRDTDTLNNADIVVLGLGSKGAVRTSFVSDKSRKLVSVCSDVESYCGQNVDETSDALLDLEPDLLWCTWWMKNDYNGKDTPPTEKLKYLIEDYDSHANVTIRGYPLGVDFEHFRPNIDGKKLDLVYMMTTMDNWYWHGMRKKYVIHYKTHNDEYHGLRCHYDNEYGNRYRDMLARARYAIVDTSRRHYMTAKYVEAIASGCILIGDKPTGMKDFFDNKVIRPVYDENVFDIMPDILNEIRNYDMVLFNNSRERFKKYFSIEPAVKEFEKAIMEMIQ